MGIARTQDRAGRGVGPRAAWAGALAIVLIALVLAPGVASRLVWDDLSLIAGVQGASPAELFTRDLFARDGGSSDLHYYRPLVALTYWLGDVLWDGAPLGYGVSSLAFHLLACGLLFALLLRLGLAAVPAATSTALFGLMPRLTESVFWISGRTDVLATVFVLGALLAYRGEASAAGRRALAGALLFLGLLCKEVAIAGVVALTVLELATAGAGRGGSGAVSPLRAAASRVAPLWLAVLAYLGLRAFALDGLWQTSLSLGAAARLALAAESLGLYVLMLLDPVHPALRLGSIFAPRSIAFAALGVATALGGTLLFWRLARLRRAGDADALLGLALAGAGLGLVMHLLPFGSDTVAADRFLYLPWAGLVIAGAAFAMRLSGRGRRVASVAAAAGLVAFAVADLERAATWRDDALLWHHTVRRADPHDSLPHAWLGIALLDRSAPRTALPHLTEAVRIEMAKPPGHRKREVVLEALANTSAALSALGRDGEALHAIEQVVGFAPGHAPYRLQRARVLGRLLRFDSALESVAAARAAGAEAAEVAALEGTLRDEAAAWRALPPASRDEPAAVAVRRAEVFARLGALAAAESIFREVLARPGLGFGELLAAAEFHAFRADPATAAALVERLERFPEADPRRLEALRAAAAGRGETVPPEIAAFAEALAARS